MAAQRVSCGIDFHYSPDLNNSLDVACKAGYDFLCAPLINPRYKREFCEGPAKTRRGPLTRSDLLLPSQDWSTLVVAKVSPWLQLDSDDAIVRKNSEQAFQKELCLASHLSVPAILIPVNNNRCHNMARCLNEHILKGFNHQFWIRLPMRSPKDELDDVIDKIGDSEEERSEEDTWQWWNTVRMMCDGAKRLGIALELTADLPNEDTVARWMGEPVKAIVIPTSIFLSNKRGFPVLPKAHQAIIKQFFKLDCQMIISGSDHFPDKGIRTYQQYLEHLWNTQDPPDMIEHFAKGYEDYLQSPLQPLMDNLESQTYEVFEKDPIKYSQYQKAIYQALLDRIPAEEKETKEITLMVVGAGRGPLVRAAINAANNADRKIRVYAVEKNENAVVTLENLKEDIWGDQVTIVSCDMRQWEAPEKADILVSELLGSFGDNELSPECLDGAQKFLKDDGISIPASYTSFIAPLSSAKLYSELRTGKEPYKPPETPFEMPYVVRLRSCNILDEPKPVFTFHHPNRASTVDNSRYVRVDFDIDQAVLMHGFAGYFECVLYENVTLSINPKTHSPGMFSWFPIYFPVKEPIHLTRGCKVTLHMWRCTTEKNVWYEWCVTDPIVQPIHNPKGRSYTIGL